MFYHLSTEFRLLLSHLRPEASDNYCPCSLYDWSDRCWCSEQFCYVACRTFFAGYWRWRLACTHRNRGDRPCSVEDARAMVWHNQRHVVDRISHRTDYWWSLCSKRFLGMFLLTQRTFMYNTDHIQRWLFWINLPFIGIAFVFVPLFLKLYFKQSPWIVQLKRVDWIGSFIFIASSTSFLIPITWVCPEHIQHFVDTYFSRVESRTPGAHGELWCLLYSALVA